LKMKRSPEKEDKSLSRPKTSRGKAHPSPDEFFDYVVPSPEKGSRPSAKVNSLKIETTKNELPTAFAGSTPYSRIIVPGAENFDDETDDAEDELNEKSKKVRLLGCWLFGSFLRI